MMLNPVFKGREIKIITMKTYAYFLILLAGMFTFAACDKDDDLTSDPETSIVDIASSNNQFSMLVTLLERSNLVTTLDDEGPFTVFAPTNDAFNQLGINIDSISDIELRNILLYHVIPGEIQSADLPAGQTYAATAATNAPELNRLSLLINKSATGIVLNANSTVTNKDMAADNGVIHTIDQVLLPLDIKGHVDANPDLSSLTTGITTAPGDLDNMLSSEGPYTVFAPVNSAFEDISDTVSGFTPEELNTVLRYHIIDNVNLLSNDITDNMVLEAINGQTFTVDLEAGPMIFDQSGQSTSFVLFDIQTTNGVIHLVDNVLIPNLDS